MSFVKKNRVAILMGTYQGEHYIDEQLKSFSNQSYKDWCLYVSDDGSTDSTREIIAAYANNVSTPVEIFDGPHKGFVANFLSLLTRPDVDAEYYCFSDQDDIWHDDKIERAVKWLNQQPDNIPALYCSRTLLVDGEGNNIGISPLFERLPSFSNALVQNIGGGNTMMLNKAARGVVARAGLVNVVSHDWWIYILISGVEGNINYDPEPTLYYRQHQQNLIGTNLGLKARFCRLMKIFKGSYRGWNNLHLKALRKNIDLLTDENKRKVEWFSKIHNNNLLSRIYYFFKLGLHRQSSLDTVAVFIAVLFKKV